jgi:hypothetical protein
MGNIRIDSVGDIGMRHDDLAKTLPCNARELTLYGPQGGYLGA